MGVYLLGKVLGICEENTEKKHIEWDTNMLGI